MDYHLVLAVLSAVLTLASIVPYIRDMLHGTTRPNIVSWGVWTLLQLIAIFAQINAGASWSLVVLITMTVNTGLVLSLALAGYGYKEYGRTDVICFVLAIIAVVLWRITGNPLLALIFAVVADTFASIPTALKAYREPESENRLAWIMATSGSLLALSATAVFNAANIIYPIYLVFQQGSVLVGIFFGKRRRTTIKVR